MDCYYCDGQQPDGHCDSLDFGVAVTCQTDHEEKEHYGNRCAVGHTGNFRTEFAIRGKCLIFDVYNVFQRKLKCIRFNKEGNTK